MIVSQLNFLIDHRKRRCGLKPLTMNEHIWLILADFDSSWLCLCFSLSLFPLFVLHRHRHFCPLCISFQDHRDQQDHRHRSATCGCCSTHGNGHGSWLRSCPGLELSAEITVREPLATVRLLASALTSVRSMQAHARRPMVAIWLSFKWEGSCT